MKFTAAYWNNSEKTEVITRAEHMPDVNILISTGSALWPLFVDQNIPIGDFVSDPFPLSAERSIKQRIAELEEQQTPRRIREATLTPAGAAWLANLNEDIESLRLQLLASQ